jgi:O-antigen/teichoic acid export membrane protein
MIGLAVCAKPLVILLLTEKWIACVPFLQVFCINYAFWPIHTANLNAIKAVGRSDLFLKIEIVKKMVGLIALFVSIKMGAFAIAVAFTLTAPISALINANPNKELFGYSIKEQIFDILPALLISVAMGLIIYPIQFIPIANALILIIQVFLGMAVYIGISYMLHLEAFEYIKFMVINLIRR